MLSDPIYVAKNMNALYNITLKWALLVGMPFQSLWANHLREMTKIGLLDVRHSQEFGLCALHIVVLIGVGTAAVHMHLQS